MDDPQPSPALTVEQAKARLHELGAQPVFPALNAPTSALLTAAAALGGGLFLGGLLGRRGPAGSLLRLALNPKLLSSVVPVVVAAVGAMTRKRP